MNGESPLDRFRRWYALLPPALRLLMTVNAVCFVAWIFVSLSQPAARFVLEYLALNPELPTPLFRPWQLLSYSVLHLELGFWGLLGFAFDLLWLYWMGRDYEETYGSHRLFGLYVLTALGGALLAVLAGTIVPEGRLFPVAGSMAAVFGVLCCVATLHPNRGIGLFLLGVVPLKWLAVGFLVLLVLFSLGHPALVFVYLGGAGTGYLFGKAQQNGTDLAAWAQAFFPTRAASSGGGPSRARETRSGEKESALSRLEQWLAGRSKGKPGPGRAAGPRPTDPPGRPKRRPHAPEPTATGPADIDRILDKINERGYDALTEDEKRALYEASQND